MLFGALLVIAPAAAAQHDPGHVQGLPPGAGNPNLPEPVPPTGDEEDDGNNLVVDYDVLLLTGVGIENPILDRDLESPTTTFTYVFDGPVGEDISHVVVGAFCTTPIGFTAADFADVDPSTDGTVGLKIAGIVDGAIGDEDDVIGVGETVSFVFAGLLDVDPKGSTWTLKKSDSDTEPRERPGPKCPGQGGGSGLDPLSFTAVCSEEDGNARFRVTNTNNESVAFSWAAGDATGAGTAPAADGDDPGHAFFSTPASDGAASASIDFGDAGGTVPATWTGDYCTFELDLAKVWQGSVAVDYLVTAESGDLVTKLGLEGTEVIDDAAITLRVFDTYSVKESSLGAGWTAAGLGTAFTLEDASCTTSVVDGQIRYDDCIHTVTNTYRSGGGTIVEEKPATVVIREVVIGTPAEKVPAGWAFGFSANSTDDAADVSAAARKTFELGEDDPETTFTVEPGFSLNVAQDEVPTVDGGVWSFLGTACEGADADDVTAAGQAVTVTPDADDVITCTFTTEFTALEVAPAPGPRPSPAPAPVPTPKPVVTPPTPAPVPVPAPKATPTLKPTEVLGETVTRTPAAPAPAVLGVQTTRLADTGTGSFGLAGFGLMLLTLGGALVAASRLGRLGEG